MDLNKMVEWVRTRRLRTAAAMGGGGVAFALLGQPMDSILGALAIVAIIVGFVGALLLGLPKFKTPKGKSWIVGGLVAFVAGLVLISMSGFPIVPSSVVSPPTAAGTWNVCITQANYATIGAGTCPNNMVASKAVLKSQTAPTSNYVVYFNITVTPPSGANTASYNVIVGTGSVPTLTNTTNPTETAPVLALNTGGTYAVTITPASGTATQQTQTVPITPGTSKVIAFQVKFSPIIGELSLGQYPVGVTTTYTIVDQSSGTVYGTITLSTTFS